MTHSRPHIAVIGAGPAGLMAAERLSAQCSVTVFDRMPSPGRKFLMAGRGGLNLTHSENLPALLARYGTATPNLTAAIEAFPPEALIAWANALGQETFTGSSGRIFPRAMKASPLLRAWLRRLTENGVTFRLRHTWQGWTDSHALRFETPEGPITHTAQAIILALGGASWPRLGSNGHWTTLLPNTQITPWRPANMGFTVPWSAPFRTRFAGQPLKRIALTYGPTRIPGEAMITEHGIEGGAIYALSAQLRDAIAAHGETTLHIDLRPDLPPETLAQKLRADRGSRSLSNHLRVTAGLPPIAIALVQEALHTGADPDLPCLIKSLPIKLTASAPIDRAISSAGGLAWSALNDHFMLHAHPGTFAAGEMLDWEAPTGGYLLQASLSTAVAAARGALAWLNKTA